MSQTQGDTLADGIVRILQNVYKISMHNMI